MPSEPSRINLDRVKFVRTKSNPSGDQLDSVWIPSSKVSECSGLQSGIETVLSGPETMQILDRHRVSGSSRIRLDINWTQSVYRLEQFSSDPRRLDVGCSHVKRASKLM